MMGQESPQPQTAGRPAEDAVAARLIPMAARHGADVAGLHARCIGQGFLSRLGPMFLKNLYRAVATCPSGFGYVWQDDRGRAVGFIACAESIGRVYKQALLRRGVMIALPLIRFALRPSVIKRIFETLRYPAEVGPDVPAAEVLSIAVGEQFRRQGIAQRLMAAAAAEFAQRGIDRVKVAVHSENEPSNRLYLRCGFELAIRREHHGLPQNIYVARIGRDGAIVAADRPGPAS